MKSVVNWKEITKEQPNNGEIIIAMSDDSKSEDKEPCFAIVGAYFEGNLLVADTEERGFCQLKFDYWDYAPTFDGIVK